MAMADMAIAHMRKSYTLAHHASIALCTLSDWVLHALMAQQWMKLKCLQDLNQLKVTPAKDAKTRY